MLYSKGKEKILSTKEKQGERGTALQHPMPNPHFEEDDIIKSKRKTRKGKINLGKKPEMDR